MFALARKYESQIIVADMDLVAIKTLMALYLGEEDRGDAQRLFRIVMGQSITLPDDLIIQAMDNLTNSDAGEFGSYLTYIAANHSIEAPFLTEVKKMKERGWIEPARQLCRMTFKNKRNTLSDMEFVQLARCFNILELPSEALESYSLAAEAAETKDSSRYEKAVQVMMAIVAELDTDSMRKVGGAKLAERTSKVLADLTEHVKRSDCLQMAKTLDTTAFELERQGKSGMALMLYSQALDIKSKNLLPNDPDLAIEMIDVARTASAQKQFSRAQPLFEKGIAILRKSYGHDTSELIRALEAYGQALNGVNQTARADSVYDEVRVLVKANQK